MGGYGHQIRQLGPNRFIISWVWDKRYARRGIRYPRRMARDTDTAGARRFAKKWNLTFNEPESES